ncbi:MAG: tetratricopeptide repeat protein [Cohaesibacteraceae bacterium]|nr:tetratricopeptide repeat protein [Cohaesibacteraceae bacterium]MBL4787473.1 tetratricopeptide repeat protein [Cohaesibacteraceae bacterium]
MISSTISGYDMSLDNAGAVSAWDNLATAFLAHSKQTPDHLNSLLTLAPEYAPAHAVKGLFCLMMGRSELVQTARECAATSDKAERAGDLLPRERFYLKALHHWLDGRISHAVACMHSLLGSWPRESLAIKIAHGILFMLGDAKNMRASLEKLMPHYASGEHASSGYMHGCYAFSLEETGDYAMAEKTGRRGLDLAPDDAWGLHAVAHVFDMTSDVDGGQVWLSSQPQAWAHCNNFSYHVSWHLALFHLDRGENDTVLHLYDTAIRADKTDDYRDISNAAALLMRLELNGVDVGNRWEELSALSEHRVDEGCLVFADLHYLMSLVGGDQMDAARTLIGNMERRSKSIGSQMDGITKMPGLSAARGLLSFAEGNHAAAFAALSHARKSMPTIGGSHAQRDVFERVTIEAAIRAGALSDAINLINDRGQKRGVQDNYGKDRLAFVSSILDQNKVVNQ